MHKIIVESDIDNLSEYEQNIITGGYCPVLLQGSLCFIDDKININYNCSGYVSLGEMYYDKISDVLHIIENIVHALICCEEYLMDINKIFLNQKKLVFRRDTAEIKLLYGSVGEGTFVSAMSELIRFFATKYTKSSGEYLKSLSAQLVKGNLSLRELLAYIIEQERDVNKKGIV